MDDLFDNLFAGYAIGADGDLALLVGRTSFYEKPSDRRKRVGAGG